MSGISYRAMTYQTRMIGASHVSVYRWVHALKGVVLRVPRRVRRVVAMDETKLNINGRQVFVWAAIDTDTRELLAVYASYYRSFINTIAFVRRSSTRAPISRSYWWTDGDVEWTPTFEGTPAIIQEMMSADI